MKKLFAAGLAAVVLAPLSKALPTVLNLSDDNTVNGTSVLKFSDTLTVNVTIFGNAKTFYAGAFSLLADDNTTPEIEAIKFDTYCVDLLNILEPFNNPYNGLSLAAYGIQNPIGLSKLWFSHLGDSLLDTTKSAAFQLAVWELTYDTNFDLNAGNFIAGASAAKTQAVTYWSTVGGVWAANLIVLDDVGNDPNKQAVLWDETPDQGVPEPFTLAFAGLGLAAALRRRAKR